MTELRSPNLSGGGFPLLAKIQVGWRRLSCRGMSSEHVPECRNRSSWRRGHQFKSGDWCLDHKNRAVGGLCGQDSRQLWCRCQLSWRENSKPSVKVNLRDGYQISIKLRDEVYSSVLIMHEQVRIAINARWSFWVREDFQNFWMLAICLHDDLDEYQASRQTIFLCLWCARKPVSALWSVFQWKQGGRPEWGRISKNFEGWRLAPRRLMAPATVLGTSRSSFPSL